MKLWTWRTAIKVCAEKSSSVKYPEKELIGSFFVSIYANKSIVNKTEDS